MIECDSVLLIPKGTQEGWSFVRLPQHASDPLPSRGLNTVEGTLNGVPFVVTLHPDGNGGHWFKVDPALKEKAGLIDGQPVHLKIAPVSEEPEPVVPDDILEMLEASAASAQETWSSITATARRDWIHWMTSAKRAETRVSRIKSASELLAKGKRRPCCFDSSGRFSQSLSCPVATSD